MKTTYHLLIAIVFLMAACINTQASTLVVFGDQFDSQPALSGWATDRKNPAGFSSVPDPTASGHGNVLAITIAGADFSVSNTFSDYQGEGHQIAATSGSPWTLSADVYISPAMISGSTPLRLDLWSRTSTDGTEANAWYPILGYSNQNTPGVLGWEVWSNAGSGSWVGLGSITAPGWYTLSINDVGPGEVDYSVNGLNVYTETAIPDAPALTEAIINMRNYGTDQSALVDNVVATEVVPEPSSGITLIGGLGMLALMRRRGQELLMAA